MTDADETDPPEEIWQRNRRLRQAQIDADNERGRQLVERYGRADHRPQFAAIGHVSAKRRRSRR